MPTLFRRPPARRRAMQWTGLMLAALVLALLTLLTGCGGGDVADDEPAPESVCGPRADGERDRCLL